MKSTFCFFVFVFVLLFSSLFSSARLLKDDKEMKKDDDEIAHLITYDFSSFVGLEACEEKDEECVKRRVAAEAHLDYIYTQSHNKP